MNGQLLACIETAVLRLYHPALGLDPLPGPHTRIVGSVAGRALVRAACFDHDIEAVVHAGVLHQPQTAYLPHDVRLDGPGCDASKIERGLGFRCRTRFREELDRLAGLLAP